MKPFVVALFTAMLLAALCHATASAGETGAAPILGRLATIVDGIEGLAGVVIGDSLVVSERVSRRVICTVELESPQSITIVSAGELRRRDEFADVVDMTYLDAAAVGVLTLDRSAGVWALVHRVNLSLASVDQLRGVVARFAAAADATRARFEGELTVGR